MPVYDGDRRLYSSPTLGGTVRGTISKITDQVCDEVAQWQQRPLDALYPGVFMAIVVKVRDGAHVTNRSAHIRSASTMVEPDLGDPGIRIGQAGTI